MEYLLSIYSRLSGSLGKPPDFHLPKISREFPAYIFSSPLPFTHLRSKNTFPAVRTAGRRRYASDDPSQRGRRDDSD